MASHNMKTNVGKAQLSYATQSGNASILSSKFNDTDRKSTPGPELKTIRSQSYSVGQQDYDAPVSPGLPSLAISSTFAGCNRQHSAALQHRPSRSSMLSEVSNKNTGLGNVKEVEDDDDESTTDGSSLHGGAGVHQVHHAKPSYEALAREVNMLRQREQQLLNARRPRAPTVGATSANYIIPGGHGIHESLIEESDYAVDEVAELQDLSQRGPGRRKSEYSAVQGLPTHMIIENRKLESVKKGAWSASAGSSDNSQSRRHSFADTLTTRQVSVSSIGGALAIRETAAEENTGGHIDSYQEGAVHNANEISKYQPSPRRYTIAAPVQRFIRQDDALLKQQEAAMKAQYSQNALEANSYFSSGSISFPRPAPEYRHTSSLSQPAIYRSSTMHPHFGGFMHSQARRDQPLYIVSFKASRGDVFYLQENTGLQVRVGDLVIVEADRGWDIGTVAHAGLSWDEARKQKENADEEHYKWLMLYSQFSQEQSTDAPCAGMMFVGNGEVSGAVGGMNAVMAPHIRKAIQDSRSGEIQPKIIKRVAQAHEVAVLQQKEGREAKAKRVCIQKAREHGIPMEILDCDFQMDGKKIIFYYYAVSYVNFHILVTDLAKVYKTRIWMSAVNPASFGTISAGHQAPSGIGTGAIGVRNGQQQDQQDQIQQYSSRGHDSGYGQTFPAGSDRALMAPQQSYQATSDFSHGHRPFDVGPRNMNAPIASYNPSMQPMDAYNGSGSYPGSGYATPVNHQQQQMGGYPSPNGSMPQDDYARHFPAIGNKD